MSHDVRLSVHVCYVGELWLPSATKIASAGKWQDRSYTYLPSYLLEEADPGRMMLSSDPEFYEGPRVTRSCSEAACLQMERKTERRCYDYQSVVCPITVCKFLFFYRRTSRYLSNCWAFSFRLPHSSVVSKCSPSTHGRFVSVAAASSVRWQWTLWRGQSCKRPLHALPDGLYCNAMLNGTAGAAMKQLQSRIERTVMLVNRWQRWMPRLFHVEAYMRQSTTSPRTVCQRGKA